MIGSPVFISSIVSLMFLSTVIRANDLAVPGMTTFDLSGSQLTGSDEIGRDHQNLQDVRRDFQSAPGGY